MKRNKKPVLIKKKRTLFRPQLRSPHPTHEVLRTELQLKPYRSIIRMGSTTELGDETSKGGNRVEINPANAIKNSADKRRMKECFSNNNVKTADWRKGAQAKELQDFPLIVKNRWGSRGTGNYYLENVKDLNQFVSSHNMEDYIIERYHNYGLEFRLHVTEDGCFYPIQKKLKRDADPKEKFQRHDDNSVWILEQNPEFQKPGNWNEIEQECVKALKSLGLTIGAIDVRVQATPKKGQKPEYFVIESSSAPSFGNITEERYVQQLNITLDKEAKKQGVVR